MLSVVVMYSIQLVYDYDPNIILRSNKGARAEWKWNDRET